MATDPHSPGPQKHSWDTAISDEILDELYTFREAYAAQFDYDLDIDVCRYTGVREAQSGSSIATIEPAERKPRS